MSRRGFTLIELIVVLAIIAVAAVVVAPSISSGIASINLKSSVNHLAATMRYARTRAISQKNICAVYLYLDEGRYSVIGAGQQITEQLHKGVKFEEIRYGNETVRQGIGQFFFTQRAIPVPGK